MEINSTREVLSRGHNYNHHYKYLHVLAMLFLGIMLFDSILVYKLVTMPFGYTSACAFIFPFWFVLADIITEVYGTKVSKNILWAAIACETLFSLASCLLVHMKSPVFWNPQPAFNLIIGNLPKIVFSSVIAILISGYLNIYFISRWKILMQGKHFWLRSIGASWIGELFYTVISIFFMMYGILTFKRVFVTIIWSYLIKALCTIFLAIPANFIATFLKNKESSALN